MTYEAMPDGTIPVFIIVLFAMGSSFLLTIILELKWKKRHYKSVVFLRNLYAVLFISVFFLVFAMIQGYITGYKMVFYTICFTIFMGSLASSLILLIQFGQEVFNAFSKTYKLHLIFIIFLVVIIILPNNYYGIPSDGALIFGPSIRVLTSTIFMLYQSYIYSILALKSFSASKQVSDQYAKIGFIFVGVSQICMILNQVFLVLDVMAFTYWGYKGGYSIFVSIGWIFVLFFIFSIYTGLLLPGYLRSKEVAPSFQENEKSRILEEDPLQITIAELHERIIHIECPTCHEAKAIVLNSNIVYSCKKMQKSIISITINENIVCPHRFQIYLDNHFDVRGTTAIDYSLKQ